MIPSDTGLFVCLFCIGTWSLWKTCKIWDEFFSNKLKILKYSKHNLLGFFCHCIAEFKNLVQSIKNTKCSQLNNTNQRRQFTEIWNSSTSSVQRLKRWNVLLQTKLKWNGNRVSWWILNFKGLLSVKIQNL